MTLLESFQHIAKNQMESEKPMQIMYGTVVSDADEPLRVRLSERSSWKGLHWCGLTNGYTKEGSI